MVAISNYQERFVMKNQELEAGTLLRYTGRPFEDFDEQTPNVIFLGYDESNTGISLWIEHKGTPRLVSLWEVEIA